MKDRKKYFLKDAIVLMIVSAMVLSAIPAVTAVDNDQKVGGTTNPFSSIAPPRVLTEERIYMGPQTIGGGPLSGGIGAPTWIGYDDGYTENGLGLTAGGEITMAIQLTALELGSYRTYDMTQIKMSLGADDFGGDACTYEVWVTNYLPADPYNLPAGDIKATGSSDGSAVWVTIPITSTPIDDTTDMWVGVNIVHAAGTYPCGIDETTVTPTYGGLLNYAGLGSWTTLSSAGFPGVWGLDVYVEEGGGPGPIGECLPDQCDFELVSINNIMPGPINSLPQVINITIRNNGEVGIAELKLLADVYEKVCGPTTTICDENVYDLCDWETQAVADWTWNDDGDGDTWVLQGGAENRWLTDDQAWRNTKGEDRSYGGDEDVYLGLSPDAVGYDELIWHCADSNDISGAACATFTFSHWVEGEYLVDCDGNTIPVDYGTISYSFDGITWYDVPIADFVAYDTEGAWQEVTLKFINTAIYEDEGYYEVCADCDPAEGDIVIDGAFPDVAKLQVKFVWHKDVCDQFEGWYIDGTSLTRTEMYELILVHQTHDIIELPPCVEAPVNIYYEFPLGFDPEPNTWYQICILGQVFDCPDCCEKIFDNNEMCLQFYVTDIHDMACTGNEIIDPQEYWNLGDSICVNATIKNVGTFAENNVPVTLSVGKQILTTKEDDMESSPMNNWAFYWFTGSDPNNHFRWTQGDTTVDKIGDGRSILPGEESIICADPGYLYPYLPLGTGNGMADENVYDMTEYVSAKLSYYAKYSINAPTGQFAGWGLLVHPTSGPDSAYWWFLGGAITGFKNDWTYYEYDMIEVAENFMYGDNTIPGIEYLFGCFAPDTGTSIPPTNPIPWSGLMLDKVKLELVTCGTMTVVDTQYTGSLSPGQEQTLTLCWDDAEYCTWCLQKDVNLPGDIDTTNDICTDSGIKVKASYPLEDWSSIDLTGGDECLWHICCTRSCDGTCCAWAGIEEEHSGHYVNDMDDSLISPWIKLSATDYPLGVVLNITSWWSFYDASDFGEIYIRNSSTGEWILLKEKDIGTKVIGNSLGFFDNLEYYIPVTIFAGTGQIQIRARMVSNSDDCVSEGWYICRVEIFEVLQLGLSAPDDTWYAFDAYSSGASSDHAVSFQGPSAPGTFTILAANSLPDFWGAGTWVGALDSWVTSYYGSGALYLVDTAGATTLIGGSVANGYTGLAYDDGADVLYGTTWTGSAANFYSIDYNTGTSTLIGSLGSSLFIDICCGIDGTIYGHDISADRICTISPTGTVTQLGLTGITANYAQGMEYDKNNDIGYLAGYTSTGSLYSFSTVNGQATLIGGFQSGAEIDSFAIPYSGGGGYPTVIGDRIWYDFFDRETIAPWTCVSTQAGDYWNTDDQIITNYPLYGKGLNDAMYAEINLEDPELTYAEFYFETEWDIETDVELFIEISPDWDGSSDMEDATWVLFWYEKGASAQAPISSTDLVLDDRFVLNEYLGETIYLRFRFVTPGEGANKVSDGFWHLMNKKIIYKIEEITWIDLEKPVTSFFFDCLTAKVTLLATDYPLLKNCGVKATYYRIGTSGNFNPYTLPFALPEGTSTVYYYSEDLCGNIEVTKSQTITVDTTPPTVEIIVPVVGKIYLFGSPIMNRILNKDTTLCIGKVPVEATATDSGSGVNTVKFAFDGKTAWDAESPYTAVYKGMKFGDLVITVTAIDNVGLESAPDTMTVKVYSLGLF